MTRTGDRHSDRPSKRGDIRRLLVKALVFVLVFAVPLLAVNHLYKETSFYKTELNDRGRMLGLPQGTTLLVLGDSHERDGFVFDSVSEGTAEGASEGAAYNLAIGSQSPYYDFALLRENADRLAPGAVVLLPVSLYTLETDFPRFYDRIGGAYNSRYYSILRDKTGIIDYSLEDDLLYNYLPVLTAKENLRYLFVDEVSPSTVDEPKELTAEDLAALAKSKATSWRDEVMVPEADVALRERTVAENLNVYQEIIDFCHERGFVPVLLVSPNTTQLIEQLGEQRIERFYSGTDALCAANPELLFLNYLQDERIVGDLANFKDADHLSSDGARLYTSLVIEDLANRGLLTAPAALATPATSESGL
jgi:hypothetical protein